MASGEFSSSRSFFDRRLLLGILIGNTRTIDREQFDHYDHDMLDLRYELMEHINREEWEAIIPGD